MSAALLGCSDDGGTVEACSGRRVGARLGFLSTALIVVVGDGTFWGFNAEMLSLCNNENADADADGC